MMRCIQLAKNGLGTSYPNPLVGSVIVYENEIIGEGWHYKSGQPHAEVNAINSVKNKSLLKDATIYVSLEPCSHFGKTPPCANLIIEKNIKKVVIGSVDPNPIVTKNGINYLIENECDVTQGVLKKECDDLNKRFFTYHNEKRPYIVLKWAETEDGFISPKQKVEKKPTWITNKKSRQLVHKWRAEEQAILIGTNTAIEDNPSLTTRNWQGISPLRFVIDRNLRIPKESTLFNDKAKTIVITEKELPNCGSIVYETIDFSEPIAQQICDLIYRYKIQSLIIEGGSKSLQTFIDENLWDEARVFKGNTIFTKGTKAPELKGILASELKINEDTLKLLLND